MDTYQRRVRRINLLAALIIGLVTLAAGTAVFRVMQAQAEDLLRRALVLTLQSRVSLVRLAIHDRIAATSTVATRPFIAQEIAAVAASPTDASARRALLRAARTFERTGFRRVALFNSSGVLLAKYGPGPGHPTIEIPLAGSPTSRLLWAQGILLQVAAPIRWQGKVVGRVVTESPVPAIARLFHPVRALGRTGDLAICGAIGPGTGYMRCLPSTLSGHGSAHHPRIMNGAPLPMSHALDGHTGTIEARDYRGRLVVAAYQPIGKLGLGAVLKMDADELFLPIRRRLPFATLWLATVLGAGMLALRWLVSPLVREVVRSEHATRQANVRFRDSETRVRAILDHVNDGIVAVSEQGAIETFNPAAARMFGYNAEEVVGRPLSLLIPEVSVPDAGTEERNPVPARELLGVRKDLSSFPVEVRLSRMVLGKRRLLIGALRDLTDRKAAERRILHMATHDELTGLPNRNLLQDRLGQSIAQARRAERRLAVLFIDLDRFKTINDSLGHHAGDTLLREAGRRITQSLRAQDTVARQGGDEFIVVLTGVREARDVDVAVRKLLAAIAAPYEVGTRTLHAGASIGIAMYPDDGDDADTLLRNSDTAMYQAKDAGRGTYQFYSEEMNRKAAERLSLENELRHALTRGQMLMHYQPLVSLVDDSIVATEALMRWNHPDLGAVSPARFIPVAEDSGLIEELGQWALRSACRQLQDWRAQGLVVPRVVVNLSPRQLRRTAIVKDLIAILEETGIEPGSLGLEITESVIMEEPERAIGLLGDLRALGVELSLDDFGTGYSSLSYLKRFPIDKLKIDRSFVRDIVEDENDAALVAAIIAMAHNLGVRVVAEGVETERQLEFVRSRRCDEFQGYLHSRPMPGAELAEILRRAPTRGDAPPPPSARGAGRA